MRADRPVPSCCPLYYWEVEVADGGEDGSIGEHGVKAHTRGHEARFRVLLTCQRVHSDPGRIGHVVAI